MLSGWPQAALFQSYDFRPGSSFVVAVSGGSDSTALLLLLKSHLEANHSTVRLIAATVDHDLRQGSADEAQMVAAFCHKIGVEHVTLRWADNKPERGIQAAARIARHKLLAEFASSKGALGVFTGHTRDDQAETVLMRRARGEGQGGAGIAPATLFDGRVWFLRPLLQASRGYLRLMLAEKAVEWVDVPCYSVRRFERARLRYDLARAPDSQARIDAALAAASEQAAARIARSHACAQALADHAELAAAGLVSLDRAALALPDNIAVHLLRVIVATAGGAEHLTDMRRSTELLARLRQGRLRANLARALIDARTDSVYFLREGRMLPPSRPETGVVWDRRYRIVRAGDPARVDSPRTNDAPESLLRAAANAEPILADGLAATSIVAPWADFLPIFDLQLADAVASLVHAPKYPAPPLRGHIDLA